MVHELKMIRMRKARRILDEFVRSGEQYRVLPEDERMVTMEMYDAISEVLRESWLHRKDDYAGIRVDYFERYDEVCLVRNSNV